MQDGFAKELLFFRMEASQHTYHDWRETVVKNVAKQAHQNQLILKQSTINTWCIASRVVHS